MTDYPDVKTPLNDPDRGLENGNNCTSKKPSQLSFGEFVPPDGGWGWVVCFTSMLTNGTVFGVINTFGIIYVVMVDEYAKGDPNVSLKTAFVGSVCTGVTFLMCIVSSILSDRIGIRPIAVTGAVLGLVGLVSSAFVTRLEILYLTYGVCLGVGAAFSYSPSLVILGHYFKRHMGLVNGLVSFGSALFTIALSLGLPKMLEVLQIRYTFLLLAGCYFILIIGALTWKPLFKKDNLAAMALSTESVYEHCYDCCSWTRSFLSVKIFRNRAYIVWCLSLGVALLGYFVPFVHLVKHTRDVFPDSNGNLLITYLQITSGMGRLVFGKVADLPYVNRIYLQQVSFFVMGVVTVCIPLSGSYAGLIVISLIFGLCDGVFVCLLGPIAFDIVGPREASQAIGFLLGIFSIPFVVGPPVAGVLYDTMHTYDIAFYLAGATPIVGSLIMFLIPKVPQNYPAVTEAGNFASISMLDLHDRVTNTSRADMNIKYLKGVAADHARQTGPAVTELQIVRADDIFQKDYNDLTVKDFDVALHVVERTDKVESSSCEKVHLLSESEKCTNSNNSRTENNFIHHDVTNISQPAVRDLEESDDDELSIHNSESLLQEITSCLHERHSPVTEV